MYLIGLGERGNYDFLNSPLKVENYLLEKYLLNGWVLADICQPFGTWLVTPQQATPCLRISEAEIPINSSLH